MIIYINFDINEICKKILQEQLDKMELNYSLINFNEVEIREPFAEEKLSQLTASLKSCSIEIVENKKKIIIQKIKDALIEMVAQDGKLKLNTSAYLAEKLKLSYTYLSNVFTSETFITIETFIIMQKTERAKQLLAINELNVSEIGYKLNYSSTAHFSTQFKNTTGLTPTAFQRIIHKKRNLNKI